MHTTLNTSEGIALDRLVRCSNATYISDRKQVEIGQAYVSRYNTHVAGALSQKFGHLPVVLKHTRVTRVVIEVRYICCGVER